MDIWVFPPCLAGKGLWIVKQGAGSMRDGIDLKFCNKESKGLSGELEHDLELRRVGGHQLCGQRGEGRGGQLVQVQLLKNKSRGS